MKIGIRLIFGRSKSASLRMAFLKSLKLTCRRPDVVGVHEARPYKMRARDEIRVGAWLVHARMAAAFLKPLSCERSSGC
jgi:hypothetical protein